MGRGDDGCLLNPLLRQPAELQMLLLETVQARAVSWLNFRNYERAGRRVSELLQRDLIERR